MNRITHRLLLVFIVVLVFLFGILIWNFYTLYKPFFTASVLLASVIAGIASFYNPCVLPFLPVVLVEPTKHSGKRGGGASLYIVFGLTVFLAFIIALMLSSTVFISKLGNPLGFTQRALKIVLGTIIFVIALDALTGRRFGSFVGTRLAGRFGSIQKSMVGGWKAKLFLYGFFYNIIGAGCTIPILVGLLGLLLGSGSMLLAGGLILYSTTMITLMLIHTLLPNTWITKKPNMVVDIQKSAYVIQLAAATLLFITGIYPKLLM